VTIGAAAGGIVVGLLAGAAGLFAFRRSRASPQHQPRETLTHHQPSLNNTQSPPVPIPTPAGLTGGGSLEYIVEPFMVPSPSSDPSVPLLPGDTARSSGTPQPDAAAASGDNPTEQPSRRTNVYVVHHDGGRAPVTVYTEEGAEVVELPPRYPEGSTTASLESDGLGQANRRDPGSHRKVRGPRPP